MRSFWSDPYLWVHLAGLAAFPLFLEGCLIGFAMGEPFLPVWLELLFVGTVGIAPILWMQWQRPFYIFSLVAASVKPEALTDEQQQLLTLFKLPRNRILAVLVAIMLLFVLQKAYTIAPIAMTAVAFLPASHGLGLLLAAAAFFACNLFVQVPVSVASVMLSSEAAFTAATPYPPEQVRQRFTIVGLRLNQILPPVIPSSPTFATVPQATAAEATIAPSQDVNHLSENRTDTVADDAWADPIPAIDPATSKALTEDTSTKDAPTEAVTTQAPKDPPTQSEGTSETNAS